MKNNFKLLFLFCLTGISSCKKDIPPENEDPEITISNNGGVFITNEGTFQFGNSGVTYYDKVNGASTEDIFSSVNGTPLGDVCQSMCLFNGKGYIVVNNSGKIVVVDELTFGEEATITGFDSPRYFLPVSNNKAYVTDIYSNTISIVDLSNNVITGSIPFPGWSEELILTYGKAFVTNSSKDKLYVINTSNDSVEDSIAISYGANSLVEDKNGKIWVLCSGDEDNNVYARLHRINPIDHQVEQSYVFSNLTDSPWRLDINSSNDTLYFLNGGIYQMGIQNNLPATALITPGTKVFYGLGIEPNSGIIYVSDAIDFVQRGVIYRYKPDGTLINSFLGGISPNDFYFN